MQTVTVHTTQNIDIDYEVAGLGERILAHLIDLGFFIAFFIVAAIFAMSADSKAFSIGTLIVCVATYALYDLLCEIFLNGQSFGKRIMKIKVISLNGGRPSISQYFLRWLFRIVDMTLTSGVCALICVAVSFKKQRVGDIVAGTTLIKTEPRTKMDNLIFKPTLADYTPIFNTVTQLTDNDIALIHEVIANFKKTGNTVLIYNMATRIKQHLAITPPEHMEDFKFLQTIIADYSHLTSALEV